MKEISKLERVPLKEVWKHEAEFTKWLEENIDVLNDALDINLSSAEREQSAGAFSVDLVAEDEVGELVIIENQLGKSDHDHLGKLITYLTALGAKTAIWIVTDPRSEHVRAVSWLNESSSASFYLLKVEAVRIGDSPPAPLITRIVGPSEETREVGAKKKELAERDILRFRFWEQLLEKARHRTKLHTSISPTHYNWVGTSAGKRGLTFSYVVRQHEASVELYIDRGKDSEEENKAIFEQLMRHKERIETEFGGALEWQRLEGRRACRIKKTISVGGYKDEDKWPEIHEAMIDTMVRLEKALKPYIQKLKI